MRASEHVLAMVAEVERADHPAIDRSEALVEIAFDLQRKPRAMQDLFDALFLYDRAIDITKEHPLARARAEAGRAAALRRLPGNGVEELRQSRDTFAKALEVLRQQGGEEETAEAEMGYGLVLHSLAAAGEANLVEAVQAYQRALRTFTREKFAREFAILHNNLATAYLALKLAPEREVMREALAVQSFREALSVVTLEQDPNEYAMLQNNLGNALQAMRSSHPFENLARAVEAYDEALKVRNERDTPVEFANTLANKANALMNLPDDLANAEGLNPRNLQLAAQLFARARGLFVKHGLADRSAMLDEVVRGIASELAAKGAS